MGTGTVVVVGGTQGLGRELAQSYADEGRDVVVTGRNQARAESAAAEIGVQDGVQVGPGGPTWTSDQARSNRSRFITLTHAATKSRTNFSFASSPA